MAFPGSLSALPSGIPVAGASIRAPQLEQRMVPSLPAVGLYSRALQCEQTCVSMERQRIGFRIDAKENHENRQ